ncbi:hypothetical protein J3R82DRAFT_11610 [Butyriboletus roseoflavus]|nr:hypothetical protein J3R82DRAFT_11610 [Butyriboletus roseoflavus]
MKVHIQSFESKAIAYTSAVLTDLLLANNTIIAIHLATNEYKHVYTESIEEGIIQLWIMPHTKNQNWKSIEMEPGLCSTSNEYKHSLWKEILSPCGRILIYTTVLLKEHLGYCFNSIPMESEALCNAQNMLIQDPDNGDAHALIGQTMLMLCRQKPLLECILETLCGKINNTFKQHLTRESVIKHLGNKLSLVWTAAFKKYKDAIITAFEQIVDDLEKDCILKCSSPDVSTTYATCAEKVSFVLNCNISPDLPSCLPLMLCSVWDALSKHFMCIKSALIEVSNISHFYSYDNTHSLVCLHLLIVYLI